jgi:predicted dehydrogenase
MLALAGETPSEVTAHGSSFVRAGVEDVVFAHLGFESGLAGHLHLSWLDPQKERRITVVGSRRMATFDDMALEQKLTIYDKGFDPDADSYGEYITRSAGTSSPAISNREPLRIECEHFVECVRTRERPRSDGRSGLRVVAVLEALQSSLEAGGERRALPAVAASP